MFSDTQKTPMLDHQSLDLTVNKIVCIGRNYREHAKELNNPVPDDPLFFIKPNSTLCDFSNELRLPAALGEVHHELEIALLLGSRLNSESTRQDVAESVLGVGLALDLTRRALQDQLKQQGHPWERAKSFAGACPVSEFISWDITASAEPIGLGLWVNGVLRQSGNSHQMLHPMHETIRHAAAAFTLSPGDIVLTGTPAGVGPLIDGDQLVGQLSWSKQQLTANCTVVR